jgi:hypothetical protein
MTLPPLWQDELSLSVTRELVSVNPTLNLRSILIPPNEGFPVVLLLETGNGTMSAIQEMIAATNQSDLGLTLDLHQNRLGAGALLQVNGLSSVLHY